MPEKCILKPPNGWHWTYQIFRLPVFLALAANLYLYKLFSPATLACLYLAHFIRVGLVFLFNHPLKETDMPPDFTAPEGGCHLVVITHYQQTQFTSYASVKALNRAAQHARWPVVLIFAAEEKSNYVKDSWGAFPGELTSNLGQVLVTVHPTGLPGERPCAGSNIRWAITKALMAVEYCQTNQNRVLVTKLDGDNLVPLNFFYQLEYAWRSFNPFELFQFVQSEKESAEFSDLNVLSVVISGFRQMFVPNVTWNLRKHPSFLKSSYAIPLSTVLAAGNWDPWFVLDDSALYFRAFLGTGGKIVTKWLPLDIIEAPTLTLYDFVAIQFKKWVVVLVQQLGYFLVNVFNFCTPLAVLDAWWQALNFLFLATSCIHCSILPVLFFLGWFELTPLLYLLLGIFAVVFLGCAWNLIDLKGLQFVKALLVGCVVLCPIGFLSGFFVLYAVVNPFIVSEGVKATPCAEEKKTA